MPSLLDWLSGQSQQFPGADAQPQFPNVQPQQPIPAQSLYQQIVQGLEGARNWMGGDPTVGGSIQQAMSVLPVGKMPRVGMIDNGSTVHIRPEGMTDPAWAEGLPMGLVLRREGDALRVDSSRLPPDLQGSGLGVEMYKQAADLAKKERLPLYSDSTVTKDAVKMWSALKRRGYNVETPGSPNVQFRNVQDAPELSYYSVKHPNPVFKIEPGK